MNTKEKRLLFLVVVLSLLGFTLRVLFVWKHSTAFTYDQGRDLLDLREMAILKKPRLIGPTTSLHGVFSGPFWYWISIPFYFISGGHPLSSLVPLLLISFFMPIVFFLFISDKHLGFLLSLIYIFSYSFFSHSIVALNTNPTIFIIPLLLLFLAKFFREGKEYLLWLVMFLIGTLFHFEAVIGLFWLPIFLVSTLIFKKASLVLKNKRALLAFLIPFVPQIIFEFRHQFLQTKAVLTLITGRGSSLTPASGDLIFRFFDRLRVFREVFIQEAGRNLILALFFLVLIGFWMAKLFLAKKPQREKYYLSFLALIALLLVFIGFVIYPYALWPWYLGAVNALMLTLIGLAIYFLFTLGRRYAFLSFFLLAIFLFLNISKYLPWPIEQGISPDPANLRTRLMVVDLIYNDASDKGMKILTFAPYVYDYPYQYLIWWRAKTKYQYLPEKYFYLPDQPQYVPSKSEADRMVSSKKSECDYLIIEPFESQEKWFWDWRYRFPEAKKVWQIGRTRVEKLCLD